MNLVKGIASIVGLGSVATAIGVGIHFSSSQSPKIPELKKTTFGERRKTSKLSYMGFDNIWDSNWKSKFDDEYKNAGEGEKFVGGAVNSWRDLKERCRKIVGSYEVDENDTKSFEKWCR